MDKSRAVLLIIALSFLSFVMYTKYSLPLDVAEFTPDALYRGTIEAQTINPKDYYMAIHGLTFTGSDEDACDTTVKISNKAVPIGDIGNHLFVEYDGSETDFKTLIGVDGEGLFKDKDNIIMPINSSTFKNSNKLNSTLTQDTNGQHDIEIIGGKQIIIVFEDVMTWWCHAHNPNSNIAHDKSVGNSSDGIKSVAGTAIIGVAKDTTKIKIYHVKDDVISQGMTSSDITDKSTLEQIDAGVYLTTGDVVVVPSL